VAFEDQKVVFDTDGNASMMPSDVDDGKETSAQSHAPSTPPLSAALNQFTDAAQADPELGEPATTAQAGGEDGGLDLKLMKKKKKKVKAETEEGEAEAEDKEGEDDVAGDDAGLDVSDPVRSFRMPWC
jgi:translation initiation factor 2 subunit 2